MENLGSAWNEEEEEEELGGLPIPPLDDDGAFAPYTPTAFDLLHFFDEFDDNGNVREYYQTQRIGGKDMKRLHKVLKGEDSSSLEPTRNSKQFSNPIIKDQKKNNMTCTASISRYEKGSYDGDEAALERKFEFAKRKFRESYQSIEKEKKRRRIQVIDFQPMAMEVASRKMVRPKSKKSCNSSLLLRQQKSKLLVL